MLWSAVTTVTIAEGESITVVGESITVVGESITVTRISCISY